MHFSLMKNELKWLKNAAQLAMEPATQHKSMSMSMEPNLATHLMEMALTYESQ